MVGTRPVGGGYVRGMVGPPGVLTRAPRVAAALGRPRLTGAAGTAPLVAAWGVPGSGTTVAAAQIAAARARSVAWCRLAPGYTNAVDVVDMIAVTLCPDRQPERRRAGVLELVDELLGWLDPLAAAGATVALVVDEYHLADSDVDRLLGELLGVADPASTVVVTAGASRPAGLLGRVPAADVALLDQATLACTDDEAAALFATAGADPDAAAAWNAALGGWIEGVTTAARTPDADPGEATAPLLDELAGDPLAAAALDAIAAIGYANDEIVGVAAGALATVADSPLVNDHNGVLRASAATVAAWRRRLGPTRLSAARRRYAAAVAGSDPTTAIDALLEADAPAEAADVLAGHLSSIGVERALTWLYRLPPDLRRRFPPVLAAGRATVEVDSALAAARERVERADRPAARREALFALGSVEAYRGEHAAAASAFEAALRSAGDDPGFASRVAAHLAHSRFLLMDLSGARAALGSAEPSGWAHWVAAQIAAVEGRPITVTVDPIDPFDAATAALAALLDAAPDVLATTEAAYAQAIAVGGEALVAAAPLMAWSLLRDGRPADALATADAFERALGPGHRLARVHGALIRVAATDADPTLGDADRDRRRLRDLRAGGFAAIERLAAKVLDGGSPGSSGALDGTGPGDRVMLLGEHAVRVGRHCFDHSAWKSKKAFEVLSVVALAGPRGMTREAVIEEVWPGRPPDKGRTLLRTALSEIRRMLEPDRPAGEPSAVIHSGRDRLQVALDTDLDHVERQLEHDAVAAFDRLAVGLAPELVNIDWAVALVPRIDRMAALAAGRVAGDAGAPADCRIAAFERLIALEPWQRAHFDGLATIHRQRGDQPAAAEVERRWFDA
jgi:hypothetical protein